MHKFVGILPLLLVLSGTAARAQSPQPHIGYVYPAGGQRGTTFEVVVGGQFLRGVDDVRFSGPGVQATVVQYFRPLNNIDKEEREALQRKMRELFTRRLAELEDAGHPLPPIARELTGGRKGPLRPGPGAKDAEEPPAPEGKLPEHPMLRNLDTKSLKELIHIRDELLGLKKRQRNAQIAESVVLKVTIDANAAPGEREIRLRGPQGMTNPMLFEVGTFREASEQEPNEPQALPGLPPDKPLELPVLVNGQVEPGDVDRFRFRARKGEKLVIETSARHLIPYLADAVPGWFQATITLYDAGGKELAFVDDYRFDPDPVLLYEVPADGEYELEIRDSVFRGREDFVYRVAIGEQPFITDAFPLGGRSGSRTVASIEGWNLPNRQLPLGTPPGGERFRATALRRKDQVSNPVSYAVDMFPESTETEPNDAADTAQAVMPPRMINGHIGQPGDVDVYRFDGRAGQEIVAEICARRLQSPMDSLLRLLDASGNVLEWNDDHVDNECGLLTHHADSYLRARLPRDGTYCVQVSDTQHQGGPSCAYRLRLGPPRPDFALRLTPSTINLRPSGSAPVCVHVSRRDGFDGEIEVDLKDGDSGFSIDGGRIPAGCERIQMTLTAPGRAIDGPVSLQLEGRARIGTQTVHHPVVPAEDMMQAFAYRHLVPSQELVVCSIGPRRGGPSVARIGDQTLRLPVGGTAEIRFRVPRSPALQAAQLELREPPKGISIEKVTAGDDGLSLLLKADAEAAKPGLKDNLIIEVLTGGATRPGAAKPRAARVDRYSLGVLPAIPLEVVKR
jgi:hypothetical protein